MAIIGMHTMFYSKAADKTRDFFKNVLGLPFIDAGQNWIIFTAPPTELAVHPIEGEEYHQVYLMCDDIQTTVAELKAKGVEMATPVADRGWGFVTGIKMPGGGQMGLYQPKHQTALSGSAARPSKSRSG